MALTQNRQQNDTATSSTNASSLLKYLFIITLISFPFALAYGWAKLTMTNHDYTIIRKITMYLHVIFISLGAAGMLSQFVSVFRRMRPVMHRRLGRLAAVFVLTSMVAGACTNLLEVVAHQSQGKPLGGVLFAAIFNILSAAYIVGCLALGIATIRRGQLAAHKRWNIRALGAIMATWSAYRITFALIRIWAGQSLFKGPVVMCVVFGHSISLQGAVASASVVTTVLLLELLRRLERGRALSA